MIIIDDFGAPFTLRGRLVQMCHMISVPLNETSLDEMAQKIGLQIRWKQKPGTEEVHYDVTESKRLQAIQQGAIPVSVRTLGELRMADRMNRNPKYVEHLQEQAPVLAARLPGVLKEFLSKTESGPSGAASGKIERTENR